MEQNNRFVTAIDEAALEIERGVNATMAMHTDMTKTPYDPEAF